MISPDLTDFPLVTCLRTIRHKLDHSYPFMDVLTGGTTDKCAVKGMKMETPIAARLYMCVSVSPVSSHIFPKGQSCI